MTGGMSVLYVDDEPDLLLLGQLFLEQTGDFRVATSTSAREVLATPAIRSYHAIVSDYQMPDMDGITFLKAIREQYGDIPFILFTGRGREEVVIDAINNGADFYLQKGGDPRSQFAELAHKLRQAIARRQAQDELRSAYEQITASEEELRDQYSRLALSEQKTRENERRFRELAELLPQIVFETDLAFRTTFVNKQAHIQLGYGLDEIQSGFNALACIDPGQHARLRENIENLIRGDPFEHPEYTFIRKDGGTFPALIYANPIVKRGTVTGFRGIVVDITERKEYEEAVFSSRQMLQTVLDTIPQRVFWKDRNLVFLGCNKPLANDVGFPDPSMIIGKTDYDHASASIAEQYRADDREVMASGRPKINFEEPQVRPDGSRAWLRTSKVPLRDKTGETIGILGTYEDITEYKKAQVALSESEAKYRELTDSLPQLIFETDRDFRITYANRHAVSVFGFPDGDAILGQDVLTFIDPAQHADVHDSARKILAGIPFEAREYTAVKRDGTRFPVIIYSSAVYRNGTLAGFRGVVVDISARKRIEEDLLRKNEELNAAYEEMTAANDELAGNLRELRKKEEAIRSSEEKFRALVEYSLEGILIADFSGRILFINRAARQIVDIDDLDEMIVSRNVLEFADPGSRDEMIRDLQNVARGDDAYLVTYTLVTAGNRQIRVECIGKKIPFGDAGAALISMRDVTSRTG